MGSHDLLLQALAATDNREDAEERDDDPSSEGGPTVHANTKVYRVLSGVLAVGTMVVLVLFPGLRNALTQSGHPSALQVPDLMEKSIVPLDCATECLWALEECNSHCPSLLENASYFPVCTGRCTHESTHCNKLCVLQDLGHHRGSFFVNFFSHKCLDVAGDYGAKAKANVQLAVCEFSHELSDQRWELTASGFIKNLDTNLCLDVEGEAKHASNVRLNYCNYRRNGKNQRWELLNSGFVKHISSGLCLDVAGDLGTKHEANVQLAKCETGRVMTDQVWEMLDLSNWHVRLDEPPEASVIEASHMVMDPSGSMWVAGSENTRDKPADAFICKYDSRGRKHWFKTFGTPDSADYASGIALFHSSGLLLVGHTHGAMHGKKNLGKDDAFVIKIDEAGHLVWTEQFGTSASDRATAVAVDLAKNGYVTGYTAGELEGKTSQGMWDTFLCKLDPDGKRMWLVQFGSSGKDVPHALGVDERGNSFLAGFAHGSLAGAQSLGQRDAFVAKFNYRGRMRWVKQFGTEEDDEALSMVLDAQGNPLVTGRTGGTLSGMSGKGGIDAFITKLDRKHGQQVWSAQFGTHLADAATAISLDRHGQSVVAGFTEGVLSGSSQGGGGTDVFVMRFNATGHKTWSEQFGGPNNEEAAAVALNADNAVHIAGVARSNKTTEVSSFIRKLRQHDF